MQQCDERSADVAIDGVYYRLSTLTQYKRCVRFAGLKGVEFLDRENTRLRLESENQAVLAQRRADRRADAQLWRSVTKELYGRRGAR